jgi:DNA-directed RNA polymerase subunit RPC12/RpoP
MNTAIAAVPIARGQRCGVCGDILNVNWSAYDKDLKEVICPECRCRVMILTGHLAAAGLKKCTQVSGGKPLKNS